VAGRQPSADFQFFTHHDRCLGSYDPQPDDPS
jgi:hypothetical protein